MLPRHQRPSIYQPPIPQRPRLVSEQALVDEAEAERRAIIASAL